VDIPSEDFHQGLSGRTSLGLGLCSEGWVLDLLDFEAWHGLLGRFFKLPCSRAALCWGGILWRITCHYLGHDVAVAGPSFATTGSFEWSSIFGFEADKHYLCDDHLSEADIDLICGVFKVHNGKSPVSFIPSTVNSRIFSQRQRLYHLLFLSTTRGVTIFEAWVH
jgi:hypothetical protein